MTTDLWINFWGLVITTALISFAILAVRVAIGGARDVRTMLRRIAEADDHSRDDPQPPSSTDAPR